jgi:hypothetical protein
MKAEEDLILEDSEDNELLSIMDSEMSMLATLFDCDFSNLYDQYAEDRIKAVTDVFKVIALTQRAIAKRVRQMQ